MFAVYACILSGAVNLKQSIEALTSFRSYIIKNQFFFNFLQLTFLVGVACLASVISRELYYYYIPNHTNIDQDLFK